MGSDMNPVVFMFINMFIVFFVLISLWVLMRVIQFIDPTKAKKKSPEPVKKAAAAAPAPAAATAAGNNDEVVAVITAAIVAMGYSSSQIASIRPAKAHGWTAAARIAAVETF